MPTLTPKFKVAAREMPNGPRNLHRRIVRAYLRGWDARRSDQQKMLDKIFLQRLAKKRVPLVNRPGRKPEHEAALYEYSHLNAITRAVKHAKANVLNEVRA